MSAANIDATKVTEFIVIGTNVTASQEGATKVVKYIIVTPGASPGRRPTRATAISNPIS